MKRYLIPLAIFLVLLVFLGIGLTLKPRELPSPLVGKPAPAFQLTQLHDTKLTFTPQEMRGKVWLLNVWASWCVACRIEHPLLVEIRKGGAVPIYGLNYKDKREDAIRWLERFGDPYERSMSDLDGKVGIDFGVYGVPETFVIDKAGNIVHKVIGPLTPEAWRDDVLPLVRKLGG